MLQRRRKTEKEEEENGWKKTIFFAAEKERRKVFGEGKYIFAEEKKNENVKGGKHLEKEHVFLRRRRKKKKNIWNCKYIQGGFFNWSALKMTKCQTLRKF